MKNRLILGINGPLVSRKRYDMDNIGKTPHHLKYHHKEDNSSKFMIIWGLFSIVVGIIVYFILENKI